MYETTVITGFRSRMLYFRDHSITVVHWYVWNYIDNRQMVDKIIFERSLYHQGELVCPDYSKKDNWSIKLFLRIARSLRCNGMSKTKVIIGNWSIRLCLRDHSITNCNVMSETKVIIDDWSIRLFLRIILLSRYNGMSKTTMIFGDWSIRVFFSNYSIAKVPWYVWNYVSTVIIDNWPINLLFFRDHSLTKVHKFVWSTVKTNNWSSDHFHQCALVCLKLQ